MIDAVKRRVELPHNRSGITDWHDFPRGPLDSDGYLCEAAQRMAVARMRDAIQKDMRVFFSEQRFGNQDTIKLTYEISIAIDSLKLNVPDITELLRSQESVA